MHMRVGGEIFFSRYVWLCYLFTVVLVTKYILPFFFILIICDWTTRGLSLEVQWPRSDPERRVCVCVCRQLLSIVLGTEHLRTPPPHPWPFPSLPSFFFSSSFKNPDPDSVTRLLTSVSFTDVALTLAVPRQSADAFSARPRSKPRPRPRPRPQTDSSLQSLWAPIV